MFDAGWIREKVFRFLGVYLKQVIRGKTFIGAIALGLLWLFILAGHQLKDFRNKWLITPENSAILEEVVKEFEEAVIRL